MGAPGQIAIKGEESRRPTALRIEKMQRVGKVHTLTVRIKDGGQPSLVLNVDAAKAGKGA